MLSRQLNQRPFGVKLPVLNRKVNHLLYTDDLILMGITNGELNSLVLETKRWAEKYTLEINEAKTEVIALHTSETSRIFINNVLIRSSYPTYLGFTLDSKLKGVEHLKTRIRKGGQKLNATLATLQRLPHLKLTIKSTIVRACIISALGYGTEGCYIPAGCRMLVEELDKAKESCPCVTEDAVKYNERSLHMLSWLGEGINSS